MVSCACWNVSLMAACVFGLEVTRRTSLKIPSRSSVDLRTLLSVACSSWAYSLRPTSRCSDAIEPFRLLVAWRTLLRMCWMSLSECTATRLRVCVTPRMSVPRPEICELMLLSSVLALLLARRACH